MKAFVGDILLQTGQALQRVSLRAAGKRVHMPVKVDIFGLTPPVMCNSVFADRGVYIGPNVITSPDVSIGENTIIRGASEPVKLGFWCNIGSDCIITAVEPTPFDRSKDLPMYTLIGEKAQVGDKTVINSALIMEEAKIGSNVTIGYGSTIGAGAVVLDNSIVPPMSKIGPGEVWEGTSLKPAL